MKTRYVLIAIATVISCSAASAQTFNSNTERNQGKPNVSQRLSTKPDGNTAYPRCDATFRQKCKDSGGTMSGPQGWGGMTCWTSLSDSYCRN